MAPEETVDVGRLIDGRYRLEKWLGSGAHGEVWLALDIELQRRVALKRVRTSDPRPAADRKHALRREAKMLAQLRHPNVVTVHGPVVDSDELWLDMEYVPAGSLMNLGRISPERAGHFAAQLADVLAAMQRKGMLHCDIKPGNVLLTEDDQVKISDFGLSRLPDGAITLPGGRQLAGTPAFMAPEIANAAEPTPASDMFSLGATIYFLVEGHSPYGQTDDDSRSMLTLAAQGVIVEPRHAGPLRQLLVGMLARDPDQRPTADEVGAELAGLGFGRPRSAPRPSGPPWPAVLLQRGLLPRPRDRVVVIASVAVVAVAAATAATVFGSTPSPPATPRLVVANQQTVDPCALDDVDALARFGQTDKSDDDGNFNRCDVHISTSTGGVGVKVELDTSAEAGGVPQGQVTRPNGLTVVAQPLNSGECDRAIVLADQNQVDITTTTDQSSQPTTNLCGIADVATASAVHTLAARGLPQRTSSPPSWSWFYASACGLLDADALDQFPGVDALHPDVGFNNWECVWNSTTSAAFLRVRFDRNGPLTAADGQPIQLAGHSAFLAPDGYGDKTCEVSVSGRQYTDDQGQPTVELLLVIINGPQPMNQLCDQTVAIARAAAAKLPS